MNWELLLPKIYNFDIWQLHWIVVLKHISCLVFYANNKTNTLNRRMYLMVFCFTSQTYYSIFFVFVKDHIGGPPNWWIRYTRVIAVCATVGNHFDIWSVCVWSTTIIWSTPFVMLTRRNSGQDFLALIHYSTGADWVAFSTQIKHSGQINLKWLFLRQEKFVHTWAQKILKSVGIW
jgi:hypothetical protein